MSTSQTCVDITFRPSANATLSGQRVGHLFLTGVLSMIKICVAPESAMAICTGAGIASWASAMVSGGDITPWGDTFEATTVSISFGWGTTK
jgi:hypothetical protein